MKKLSTRQLAFSGILAAINVVLIYYSSVSPVLRISSLVVSSLLTAAVVIEIGALKSLIFYIAVSILSLILASIKPSVLEYILIFGIYPVIKFYIEKINRTVIIFIFKLAALNILTIPLLLIFKELVLSRALYGLNLNLPIILLVLNIAFIMYDYVLTNMISYYVKNVRNRIIKN